MPWKVCCVEEERVRFASKWLQREWSFARLCGEFGVSRKTGYKLIKRRERGDPDWFRDRPRAPRLRPHGIGEALGQRILEARAAHPTWGPRKLRAFLQRQDPGTPWPAPSTIGSLLQREGLSVRRRRRQRTPPGPLPFSACDGPNALWTADFKGWFCTGDGARCSPFTLCDAYSRYLLRCQALARTDQEALQPLFEAAFREFGLPRAIRTDNGPPFACTGLGGLTALSVWWIKLGICPQRIEPGHPEQNGRHERLHRTLCEATHPPGHNRRDQQTAFDHFRREYNEERPHEALGQRTPASRYTPSRRRLPLRLPELQYPPQTVVRRVRRSGEIKWRNRAIYVSQALAGEPVGLRPVDERFWRVYLGPVELAVVDTRRWKLLRPTRRRRARPR